MWPQVPGETSKPFEGGFPIWTVASNLRACSGICVYADLNAIAAGTAALRVAPASSRHGVYSTFFCFIEGRFPWIGSYL